jgi:hypothetical protein
MPETHGHFCHPAAAAAVNGFQSLLDVKDFFEAINV